LQVFFATYKEYATNEFYVTGESYAGKYVPAISYRIHVANQLIDSIRPVDTEDDAPRAIRINLAGVAIGDGWTDPRVQVLAYADLAYNMGLADNIQHATMTAFGKAIVADIDSGRWMEAAVGFENYVDGPPDYFQNITGTQNYYDIRKTEQPFYGGDLDAYLNQAAIRQALHVGNHQYDINSGYAGNLLTIDLCKSEKLHLAVLLNHYKALIYSGQYDFIVGVPLTENFLATVPWSGQHSFNKSPRVIWKVHDSDPEIAGFSRNFGGLTQVVVRNAGHILPFDQPDSGYDMITRFVYDHPFDAQSRS